MYNNGEEACYALAVPGSGVTALNLNYEINLFGSCTNIHTTETVFYPVIQDEPTWLKVEKDNGWIGNLIAGVAITALFAGLAIATVATGGAALAAVAFAGAAVGTAAVTAGATYSDIKSGSSRSFGDFAFQLTMGAAVGFMTGASVYGIVAALPAASAAAGVEASLIAGNTSVFTAVAVPGIVTAGGYAVAAGTGAVALNESYAIGSGTNVLLETAFNGDIQAYETTSMMIDLLGMGIVQCGIDNVALGQRRKGVYVNTVDDIIKGVEDGSIPLTNNTQKGNYGEMKMDAYFESQGYERISLDRVTDLNTPTHQGIDGVYYNSDGHPPYIIGEAKYGSSRLGITRDGMQMSDTWINGSDRLVNAVGKDMADDILLEGYGKTLVNIASDGTISVKSLD